MHDMTIPPSLNVRLRDDERAAIATVRAAISTPHRRAATLTETLRAALRIAEETIKDRDGSTVA